MIASYAWLAVVTVLGASAPTPAAKAGPTASLLRSAQRGSFEASQALDELRLRAMVDALPRARCDPPTSAELTRTATELADFMALRVRTGVLTTPETSLPRSLPASVTSPPWVIPPPWTALPMPSTRGAARGTAS